MQIYNRKIRLSRVFVKFFALIFSTQIKLFNHQLFSDALFFKNFSLYLRDNNMKREIWQIILYLFASMVLS